VDIDGGAEARCAGSGEAHPPTMVHVRLSVPSGTIVA
jgi:hypothetical protein